MKYVSVGDMAQTYLLRRHNVQLKATMQRLSDELVTGVSQDVGAAVKGDFTALAGIDRSLARIESFQQVTTEVDLLAGTQQDALELIQGHASVSGANLILAASTLDPATIASTTQDAAQRFGSILGALNVSVAGRYAFSGTATDTKPVATEDEIISALEAAISGLTSAGDIETAVANWFDAPAGSGGYLDLAYSGNDTALDAFQISNTDQVALTITATDQTLRDTLKGFALATLVARDLVPDDDALRANLTETAGERIASSNVSLTTLRADLGTTQGIIEDSKTRNSSEKSALQLSREALIGIDEYDSATALEAVQSQLETLYTLTTRLSQLSLTDYL